MLYPLKFYPVFKDYIWGGRNLDKIKKELPEGRVAECWEISCHPEGLSIISNGDFKGMYLEDILKMFWLQIMGKSFKENINRFPLLIKFIDAKERLSVQVHPDDGYANINEKGASGKNEMWYVLFAREGAHIIYDVKEGTTKDKFINHIYKNRIEDCLKHIYVVQGDVINIPAGVVHGIGEGIVMIEIQQNSNITYRIYDYNRIDSNGNKRPLHIDKALEVIDFNECKRREKYNGLRVNIDSNSYKIIKIANNYFCTELYNVNGLINEALDGSRFYIYIFFQGGAELSWQDGNMEVMEGETVLVPASIGKYQLEGKFKALKTYIPDINKDIIDYLKAYGYKLDDIKNNIDGIYSCIGDNYKTLGE